MKLLLKHNFCILVSLVLDLAVGDVTLPMPFYSAVYLSLDRTCHDPPTYVLQIGSFKRWSLFGVMYSFRANVPQFTHFCLLFLLYKIPKTCLLVTSPGATLSNASGYSVL